MIKVFGEVAFNASISCPERIFRTHALTLAISDLPSRTSFADFVTFIIILVLRALNTFLAIEDRGVCRTIHATFDLQVINLVGRTTQTFPLIQVKIFGEVAIDTVKTSEELLRGALALSACIVVDLAKASDQFSIKALSKPVTKYYICYPK